MIGPIPIWRAVVFALLVAYVLDAAQHRKDLSTRAAVVLLELAGEALLVARAPVRDKPNEPAVVHGPALTRLQGKCVHQS